MSSDVVVLFPAHQGDCPVCGGAGLVGVSQVHRRLPDGVVVASPMSAVELCPMRSPLETLLGQRPARPAPGGVA